MAHPDALTGNYAATGGIVPVPDAAIDAATPFPGWTPEFLGTEERPGWYHTCPELRYDPAANAWHVRQVAGVMHQAGRWVGPPLVRRGGAVIDGNHRLRGCQWLLARRGLLIDVPTVGGK